MRQARIVEVRDDRQQLLHAGPTTCRDDPELGHVAAKRADGAGPLCDQSIPDPMQHQQRLLGLALDRNEPHARPLNGFATTLGIGGVVLIGLEIPFTYCGGMSRTSWPSLVNSRAQ